jgi:hypothetical protein
MDTDILDEIEDEPEDEAAAPPITHAVGVSLQDAEWQALDQIIRTKSSCLYDLAGKVALFLEASMGRLAEYHVADALIAMLESDLGD